MKDDQLKLKTIEIHQQAKALNTKLPAHLKLVPEIKQALTLIENMSEVMLCLYQGQTDYPEKGKHSHAHHD